MDNRPAALHPTIPLACPQLSARTWHRGGHLDIGEDVGVVTVARVVFIVDEDSRQPCHHTQGTMQQRRTHQTLAPQAGRLPPQTVRGSCSGVSGRNTGGDTHPEIALAASAGILDGISRAVSAAKNFHRFASLFSDFTRFGRRLSQVLTSRTNLDTKMEQHWLCVDPY